VRGKQKFKPAASQQPNNYGEEQDEYQREALNIMHDKRVFRGNTHNMNLL
jgi:hypothetical protein